eukprot:COSAG01_NODE_332_length_18712_cov_41.424358_20_plen_84_part_00
MPALLAQCRNPPELGLHVVEALMRQSAAQQDIQFDQVDFVEYYDADKDPWQMTNLHKTANKATLDKLHAKLHAWYKCAGDECP